MKTYEKLDEISEYMKKAPFWKFAAFGTICVKQEFQIYEMLAKDRFFDMSKFLKKTIDRFFKAVATGYSMDEQYILAIEESFFEPRDEWEKVALQIVQDIYDMFYAIDRKDGKAALNMQERQIHLVESYIALSDATKEKRELLIKKTTSFQVELAKEIAQITAKDKKSFIENLANRELDIIFDDDFIRCCPTIKKEKPLKKKLKEIRNTSLDFDREAKEQNFKWLINATPKQWVYENDFERGQGAYSRYYLEKNLLELCAIMSVKYRIYAENTYICNRIPEQVRGFWYLNAYTKLKEYQLWEKGYPLGDTPTKSYIQRHFSGDEGFQVILSCMIYAYAAGADEILEGLYHFSSEKEKPHTYILLRMLRGDESPEIYSEIETWDDSDFKQCLLEICKRNGKEIRKAVLCMIRRDRKQYDLYRTMVDAYAYACLRLAKERQIEVEPILAAEVLDGNLEMTPIDKYYWKLPYQEEIEQWLNEH